MKEIVIKKPIQRRSKAKFQAILDTCPQVLATLGYNKATTARMALEADVSIGTLYNYFSSKEAVILAYLDRQFNLALDAVLKLASSEQVNPDQFIREFTRIGVDFGYEHRAIIRIALREFPERLFDTDFSESREIISSIVLTVGTKRFPFKQREPRLMIYTLTNLVLGFLFRSIIGPDERLERASMVDELACIIENYILEKN